MAGRGRGWRRGEMSEPAVRILTALRGGGEKYSVVIARESGLAASKVLHVLDRLKRDGLVSSRLESVAEHQARDKEPGDRNKGSRRTYWKITAAGKQAVSG